MGTYFAGDMPMPFAQVRLVIPRRRVNRPPRVRSSLERMGFRLTSKALGPIMNVELKELQSVRRARMAAEKDSQ